MDALVIWLDRVGSIALSLSISALVILDLAALAAVAATRDRALVNRWTGRVLAANLALLGIGVAGPAVAFTGRLAASVIGPLLPTSISAVTPDDAPKRAR